MDMRILKKELWPCKVSIPIPENNQIEVWLDQNLGRFKGRWNVVYNHSTLDYYFRNGQDATLFALRWL